MIAIPTGISDAGWRRKRMSGYRRWKELAESSRAVAAKESNHRNSIIISSIYPSSPLQSNFLFNSSLKYRKVEAEKLKCAAFFNKKWFQVLRLCQDLWTLAMDEKIFDMFSTLKKGPMPNRSKGLRVRRYNIAGLSLIHPHPKPLQVLLAVASL